MAEAGTGKEPRRLKRRGSSSGNLRQVTITKLVLTCHEIVILSSLLAKTDDDSREDASPATGLPGEWLACGVLDLPALRSRAALLQPGLPLGRATAATPLRQPPPPAEPGGAASTSRPPAGVSPPPAATARDESIFPGDHALGIIPMWALDATAVNAPESGCGFWPLWPEQRPGVWLRCRAGGRTSRFVDPSPRISRRR